MKKILLLAFLFTFIQTSFSQVVISNISSGYVQDFNSLAASDTSSNTPTGWMFVESGTNANSTYLADNGTANSGNTYSYGATGSSDRAFGMLLSGSLVPTIGVAFTNNSSSVITAFTVSYIGEQWRLGNAGRVDRIDFQYSTNATSLITGTWTDVDALDFSSPTTSGTVGPLDGNATANRTQLSQTISNVSIQPGQTFYIRWTDFNASGADDGLSVDDFAITFNGAALPNCTTPAAQPTNLTFGTPTTTTISGNFTAASPVADQYIVVMSTSSSLTATPQNGTTYNEGDNIGNGVVVDVTSSTSFAATNLTQGTTYYFFVFSVNSACTGGPMYNTTSPLTGQATTATPPPCATPTGTPGAINFTTSGTSIAGSFTGATGADSYLIIRSTNASIDFTPANGTNYTVGQTVGTSSTGTVIKAGEGTTFTTTGLTNNTTYYFFVYAMSSVQCTGGPLYNTNATTGSATTTSGTGVPAGYYSNTTDQSCATLKTNLKNTITTGHNAKSYGELWTQFLVSDIKPREVGPGTSTNVIWDVYSDNPNGTDPYNFTPGPVSSGGQQDNGTSVNSEGQLYNREHSVPLSWFNGSTSTPGPATDYHHIFPTDKHVNAVRSNYIYGEVANATYTSANGSKLGSSAIAGFNSNTIVFEPINEYKGDLARAFLYFVTRYQDNMPNWTGGTEGSQAFDPSTYPSVDIPYLQLMIKWHNQDPVSQKEIDRNNAGYNFQGNRNPYVDSPQYVNRVWNNTCPGLAALPVHVTFFGGKLLGEVVKLEWKALNEIRFDRYEVERSVNGTSFTNIGTVKASARGTYTFDDAVASLRGQRVFYRLKLIDKDGEFKFSPVFSIHIPFNTKFSIYPNPANSFIQLQFNNAINGSVNIQIADATGKVVLQRTEKVSGSNLSLSTSTLSAGTYLVKMMYKGETYVQKVMVVK